MYMLLISSEKMYRCQSCWLATAKIQSTTKRNIHVLFRPVQSQFKGEGQSVNPSIDSSDRPFRYVMRSSNTPPKVTFFIPGNPLKILLQFLAIFSKLFAVHRVA